MSIVLDNLLGDWQDIDWLKQNHERLYYFGLGFIQLKINDTYRLHFYSPELPPIVEDIHNHRYDFVSTVIKGQITNHVYAVLAHPDMVETHIMRNESCNPDIDAPQSEAPCSIKLISSSTIFQGGSYEMKEHMFHRVEANYCVTLLRRGPYTKEFAQVITPADKTPVCPFSQKIPEPRLWEIIERSLCGI